MKGATHDLHRRSRIRRRRRCYDHAPCGHHVHRHHGSCGRRHDGSYGLDDRDSRLSKTTPLQYCYGYSCL